MNRRPTLYVTDLDGTLLDASSRVSAGSACIIRGLVEEGARITVATARTPATVDPLLRDCGLRLPAIVMTGAALWDFPLRRYLSVDFISAEACRAIGSAAREEGVTLLVYTLPESMERLEVFATGPLTRPERRFVSERDGLELKRFHVDSMYGRIMTSLPRTILFFAMGEAERIARLADRIAAEEIASVSAYPDIADPSVMLIEMFAPDISKARAVRRVMEMSGAERVVVFGDNLNDLPMMEVADVAVAVENAMPEVKEAADIVIGPNTADSVARFIYDDFHSPGHG